MTYVIKNEDLEEVLIGVPKNHKHLRVCLKTRNNKTLILNEAAIANIVRAYITVKTHPTKKAVKLIIRKFSEKEVKEGFAKNQLLEVEEPSEIIEEEIAILLDKARLL